MPFRPKVVPGDPVPVDEEGQLQLPDDLQQIGQQLTREATALAEQYSTDRSVQSAADSSAEPRRLPTPAFTWISVTIALAAILLAVWWPGNDDSKTAVQREQAPDTERNEVTQPNATQPAWEPHSVVFQISGPEMEGVLDILEQQESDQLNQVSF